MTQFQENKFISDNLINWYSINKRQLPWRDTTDPYVIWISEIILQQTRVLQGTDYFVRFIKRFPDIITLANSSEEEVLNYWQGLGYYSRARNLHAASQQIMNAYAGQFPSQYELIAALPGIGPYTAAAVASFAFQLPFAVIDGNVFRFLTRFFGINTPIDETKTRKQVTELATLLLNKNHPDIHNQAIMEFGALQCVPYSPNCTLCPFENACFANIHHLVAQLPIKKKKAQPQHRYFYYIYFVHDDSTYLQKRATKDIWHNLYEFPLFESKEMLSVEQIMQQDFFKNITDSIPFTLQSASPVIKHVLSHQIIHAIFLTLNINKSNETLNRFVHTSFDALSRFPISRLTEKFLQKQTIKV
jgi:A/G-specific adenine glycosylase